MWKNSPCEQIFKNNILDEEIVLELKMFSNDLERKNQHLKKFQSKNLEGEKELRFLL
jgi:hypothetical protein